MKYQAFQCGWNGYSSLKGSEIKYLAFQCGSLHLFSHEYSSLKGGEPSFPVWIPASIFPFVCGCSGVQVSCLPVLFVCGSLYCISPPPFLQLFLVRVSRHPVLSRNHWFHQFMQLIGWREAVIQTGYATKSETLMQYLTHTLSKLKPDQYVFGGKIGYCYAEWYPWITWSVDKTWPVHLANEFQLSRRRRFDWYSAIVENVDCPLWGQRKRS